MNFQVIESKVLELWPEAKVRRYEPRAGKHALRVPLYKVAK